MGEIQLNNTSLQQALQQLLQGNAKSNTDNQLNADLMELNSSRRLSITASFIRLKHSA